MSNIAVIGTGYVGLSTGAYLAHLGHDVVCADVDEAKVERLRRGELPIVEPGLDELAAEGIASSRLSFVVGALSAIGDAEFVFLAVPTPQGGDGAADLSYVRAAAAEIGPHLRSQSIVINKSTVPVGASHIVEQELNRSDVFVVSNPEFLREGSAVYDCLHPDRIVVGSASQSAAMRVADLYERLKAPVLITDCASAEAIKYASNAFLSLKVTFINAMANVCEAVGADVREVSLGMGYDKRIGFEFLKPGPGFGGSCFPKDIRALVKIADDASYDFSLLKAVIDVNDAQFDRVVDKVERALATPMSGARVGVLGLTFKANTDDLRDSPALEVINRLTDRGADVVAYDPTQVDGKGPHHPTLDRIAIARSALDAATDAMVLLVLTEWDEFRWLDFGAIHDAMAKPSGDPAIVDARNLLDGGQLRRKGFRYQAMGRN